MYVLTTFEHFLHPSRYPYAFIMTAPPPPTCVCTLWMTP